MNKKILIINSSTKRIQSLSCLLEELSNRGFLLQLFSIESPLAQFFIKKNWPYQKLRISSPFLFFLPIYYIAAIFRLYLNAKKYGIDTVVCLSFPEKIIYSLPAKLMHREIVWIEWPENEYKKLSSIQSFMLKKSARFAKIGLFSQTSAEKLAQKGIKAKEIVLCKPYIIPSQYKHQDTIFEKMARDEGGQFHRKYFTLGTVLDLNKKQNLEMLFQSVKTCLTIVPNLQLVIIGEGEERKNLSWLVKKMQIDNLVWFVGAQASLKKWLSSFDIYIVTAEKPDLDDLTTTLMAMASGLPVIGPQNQGLEDFIIENKSGSLVEMDNSEMLARQIIKLHQNTQLRQELGKNAAETIDKDFMPDIIIQKLEELLVTQKTS